MPCVASSPGICSTASAPVKSRILSGLGAVEEPRGLDGRRGHNGPDASLEVGDGLTCADALTAMPERCHWLSRAGAGIREFNRDLSWVRHRPARRFR
jgi:hypothetical protein